MFSKFKSIGLNSFLKNLNAENFFTNFKRNLPQLTTVRSDYNRNHNNKKSLLLKPTNYCNYLLISVISLGYLDKKYDLKNLHYFDQFKVNAKEPPKEEPILIDKTDKKNLDRSNNIRNTFNFIADAAEKAIPW